MPAEAIIGCIRVSAANAAEEALIEVEPLPLAAALVPTLPLGRPKPSRAPPAAKSNGMSAAALLAKGDEGRREVGACSGAAAAEPEEAGAMKEHDVGEIAAAAVPICPSSPPDGWVPGALTLRAG